MPIISFRFALDNMVRNISKFAIFVIMMIVCLVMILLLQLIYKGETYSYNELDKLLSEGVAGTGVLRFTSDRYFSEIGYEFLRERRPLTKSVL